MPAHARMKSKKHSPDPLNRPSPRQSRNIKPQLSAMAHPFKDAHAAWECGKLKVAFRLFLAQAKAGDSGARLNLGYFYDVGLGTRKNKAQALRWYRRAYQQGSGAAASNIANVYRDKGRVALALAWYKRAVSLKDDDAAIEVAKHYL